MNSVKLGLKENWKQFSLLVLVNAFVGGMVGLERTVVPLVGTTEFGIGSDMVIFSFITAFGVVKAFTNIASGILAEDRKSVAKGKSVSVRVDLGGRLVIKKKITHHTQVHTTTKQHIYTQEL